MTLSREVQDALKELNTRIDAQNERVRTKDAEIASLIDQRDMLLRQYNEAESRLAAANALLRNVMNEGCSMRSTHDAIQTHLQGAGDE